MATTVVYPSLDVSGTGSISTIISTAGTFTGSLTASSLTITGTATFSGTAVFVGTVQHLATTTFVGVVAHLATASFSSKVQISSTTTSANAFEIAGPSGVQFRIATSAAEDTIIQIAGSATGNGPRIQISTFADANGRINFGIGNTGVPALGFGDGTSTRDVFLGRQAAGVIEINDSNAGTFKDLRLGNLSIFGSTTHSGNAAFLATTSFAAEVQFKATASFSVAPQVGGFQLGMMKLGSANGATNTQFKISGVWTAYQSLQLDVYGKGGPTTTNLILILYSDGGTTPFMIYPLVGNTSATASDFVATFNITGSTNTTPLKMVFPHFQHFTGIATQATQTRSATMTVSAINCIGIATGVAGTTTTFSSAAIYLYGRLA